MANEAKTRRLRIAVLSRHFNPAGGGAERYSVALVQQLVLRHEIHVFAQEFGIDVPGVINHHVPHLLTRPRWLNLLCYNLWVGWATRSNFDIVHSHEASWCGNVQTVHVRPIRATRASDVRGLRRLLRRIGVVLSPRLLYYIGVERARLTPSKSKAVVAVSDMLRDELEACYPALKGHVDVVPPGVSPVSPDINREETRRRFKIPSDVPLMLFVARDYNRKGLPALMQAMTLELRPHLLIAGSETENAAVRLRAEALGIEARVHFAGILKDPWPAYHTADLLVHPTLEDTFGMVVAEAMSQGLPVVVSGAAWCGISAGLTDGENALVLADPRDAIQIAHAVGRVLDSPPLRDNLRTAGRHFATQFDWPALALRQEAIYRQILANT